MENFGKLCFGILILLLSTVIEGWVFQKIWEWLVAGTFGFQLLTWIQAVALAYAVKVFTQEVKTEDPHKDDTYMQKCMRAIIYIVIRLITLFIAWLIFLVM